MSEDRVLELRERLFDKDNRSLEELEKIEIELIKLGAGNNKEKDCKICGGKGKDDLARITQIQLRQKYLSIKYPHRFGKKLSPAAADQIKWMYGDKDEKEDEDDEEIL